jgi:hypothetical protein
MLNRDEALTLLSSQNPEPHMLNHALQSEAVMRALAAKLGHDEELWGITGLLHDLDFPCTKDDPGRHGLDACTLIGDKLPENAVHAISAHNSEYTKVEPEAPMDYGLRAAETVTGLVSAAALVRPSKMEGMKAKSLKKKMKDKSFAANVNRERIMECEKLGIELGDFLTLSIEAVTGVAAETGLA